MDKKTQEARARNKAMYRARLTNLSGLPDYDARGLGRKGKPSETFATRQCNYVVGGKEKLIRRNRKTRKIGQSDYYFIPLILGGKRCTKSEMSKGRCLEHLGATYEKVSKKPSDELKDLGIK